MAPGIVAVVAGVAVVRGHAGERLRQRHRREGVDAPGAGGGIVCARLSQVGSALPDHLADIHGQTREAAPDQGGQARHLGCRHGGAAQRRVCVRVRVIGAEDRHAGGGDAARSDVPPAWRRPRGCRAHPWRRRESDRALVGGITADVGGPRSHTALGYVAPGSPQLPPEATTSAPWL